MKFHVVSLPHTNTTAEFPSCAFTQKVVRFCNMMKDRGHEVVLYAGEKNEALCDEHVKCVSAQSRVTMNAGKHYTESDWGHPLWETYNKKVIKEMKKRISPQDFICLIGGYSQKPIAEAFPQHLSVEFGIGYAGTFAQYRVFESYAWMHTIYGADSNRNASGIDGKWFDAVIPNQIEDDIYTTVHSPLFDDLIKTPYALYLGRLIDRKGYKIAQDVCERKGIRLVLAGPGKATGYGEFVGEVNKGDRNFLMKNAMALFVPTHYIEPFGTVHIEAMAQGTPVITTDWGVFTETVVNGVHGFRCRTFKDFSQAIDNVKDLNREVIKSYAYDKFNMKTVGKQYEDYFTNLQKLWNKDGWYSLD